MELSELIGKTLIKAERVDNLGYSNDEGFLFVTGTGDRYGLFHSQECCESVNIEDVSGDLSDLIGSPILVAEERHEDVPGKDTTYDVWEWTFYEFRTLKGSVTIKFEGNSNGYYGTSADFCRLKENNDRDYTH